MTEISTLKFSLLILFPFLTPPVLAQEYQSLLDETAQWNYQHQTFCEPFTPSVYEYSVHINGDTTINGMTYKQLFRPHLAWIDEEDEGDCSENFILATGYVGALREDEAERTVYFAPPGEDEVVLYDFNQEAGDPLNDYLMSNWNGDPIFIEAVDSVEIGGFFRTRIVIDSTLQSYIIEGIGSTFGLIDLFPPGALDSPGTELICWQTESANYPEQDPMESCLLITDVSEAMADHLQFTIFPNPAEEYLRIKLVENMPQAELLIANSNGQVVHRQELANSASIEVQVAHLSPGKYFITLKSDEYSGTNRSLKSNAPVHSNKKGCPKPDSPF